MKIKEDIDYMADEFVFPTYLSFTERAILSRLVLSAKDANGNPVMENPITTREIRRLTGVSAGMLNELFIPMFLELSVKNRSYEFENKVFSEIEIFPDNLISCTLTEDLTRVLELDDDLLLCLRLAAIKLGDIPPSGLLNNTALQNDINRYGVDPDLMVYMGYAHEIIGRHDEAISDLEQALKLDPEIVDAYVLLGKIHSFRNELSEAEECYRKILAIDPYNIQVMVCLGDLLLKQAKPEDALAVLLKTKEINAWDPAAHRLLGDVYYAQGQYDDALEAYQFAIASGEKDYNTLLRAGICYGHKELHLEAANCLEKACRMMPESALPLYLYSLAMIKAGDRSEAMCRFIKFQMDKPEVYDELISCHGDPDLIDWNKAVHRFDA